MHELSLCKHILEIISHHVIESKAVYVKKICLEIGQLTGVDQAALLFSFDVVAKGTVAECAMLEIIEVKGMALCNHCQKQVMIKRYYDACHACGHFSLTVIQGEELQVKHMEVNWV